ncbi:MAG: 7-carboxy-7-deazaguanine synthase QueE [Verrucomicrobiae bacterium]|nr:7-carboxy-7-deazaguanine synthase QueE [Verrucomicrobiae bacterium]
MKLARLTDGKPEIFFTIQGEGRNAGLPSVFIRSSLCNLHCRWCDTDYTWNWEGTPFHHDREGESGYAKYRQEEQIVECSIEEVAEQAAASGCANFVFTGGEPLLHESDWVALMVELQQRLGDACHFEIETNGTRLPGRKLLELVDQLNVSPKLANSGMKREQRIREDVLRNLTRTGLADFKFVVDSEEDLSEVKELVDLAEVAPHRVFLMPKGITVAQLDDRAAWLVRECQANGFRFSDRLHVRLFGARRGV